MVSYLETLPEVSPTSCRNGTRLPVITLMFCSGLCIDQTLILYLLFTYSLNWSVYSYSELVICSNIDYQ